jgi:hypothetical protein
MFGLFKTATPRDLQVRALNGIADHCQAAAEALAADLTAFRNDRKPLRLASVNCKQVAGWQEKSSPNGETLLILASVGEGGTFNFDDMLALWRLQGDVELFRMLFQSNAAQASLGTVDDHPLKAHVEEALTRGLTLATCFSFAAQAHAKDYLTGILLGKMNPPDTADYRSMLSDAQKAYIGRAKALRTMAFDVARYDRAAIRGADAINKIPAIFQVKELGCEKTNEIWLQKEHVVKLRERLGKVQASAFSGQM